MNESIKEPVEQSIKKIIAEMKNESKYFMELQIQENTPEGAMRWHIERIKRNYAIEILELLLSDSGERP
jgi:predicted nucleotide-binding protein (sugar kinase/HSP70/actin superfamily)